MFAVCVFFFQAEDGIRDLVRSRGLGDVYKRQVVTLAVFLGVGRVQVFLSALGLVPVAGDVALFKLCLLYTSDAADDLLCVDLGGCRIITKKNSIYITDKHCTLIR